MRKQVWGFTLIELMIVVAIIAIIAAIAIPGLIRARISANEGSAIGSLRSMSTSQAQFQSGATVDQNKNGTGEYGLLNELSGATQTRDNLSADGPGETVKPGFISIAFKAATAGAADFGASKSGYFYQVFLPDSAAVISDANVAIGTTASDDASVTQQEVTWIAYASPLKHKSSGIRAFAIDVNAEVVATANTDGDYGLAGGSAAQASNSFDDAMDPGDGAAATDLEFNRVAAGVPGADGKPWAPTGGG